MATTTTARPVTALRSDDLSAAGRKTWGPNHYLAIIGVVLLVWQLWTWTAWLLDGPEQITQFRSTHSAPWWLSRTYEVLGVIMLVGVGTYVIRRCIRERRLTFDAKLIIVGMGCAWLDAFTNVMQPLFMYSSNFVNLNSQLGNMPFVVNPDGGRLPWPFLFLGCMYTVGLVFFAMILNVFMRAAKRRWPSMSTAKLIVVTAALGCAIDFAFEIPMYLVNQWAYPGSPDWMSLYGATPKKFPLIEILPAALLFGGVAALRYFKDDSGRGLTERGLTRHRPGVRTLISILALLGVMNIIMLVGTGTQAVVGFYSSPYKKMPDYIVNDMCDAPGVGPTAYGPCPGSPGYEMPVRHFPDDP